MTSSFSIGRRPVGGGAPCYVIAEAGVNHDGDVAVAHQLVDAAADSGADAVKFQAFDPKLLVSSTGAAAEYQAKATGAKSQQELLRGLVLPESAWRELMSHARERDIEFLCTPFDVGSADMLDALGVTAFKVSSGDLDNAPFLRDLASRGKPIILSTGMATLIEIADALDDTRRAPGVAVLHCVTAYPAPVEASNLRVIPELADRFRVPTGWSDHTAGIETSIAAAALGASIIEKHVTLDRTRPGPDHAASADPETLTALVAGVRAIESALGDGVKRPTDHETAHRVLVRRSWHTVRPILAGSPVTLDDLILLRPATGLGPSIDPTDFVAECDIPAGVPLTESDLRPAHTMGVTWRSA